ncbi:energy-coupling factor transporter transmembrane component T family protein [Brachybacterium timonense]|uniref:energy-coupling factor transporter transmembrane component T family protein n=1 Tax=Brachybacterium timonense TaxID=2050896 RepID=UPI000D0B8818|nr:energy-coupling factor transporter transmembrane component T [Brachybacterium timonense]
MSSPILGYVDRPGLLHRLSGVSKLALAIGVVVGAMVGFDLRYLLAVSVLSAILWALSRVRLRDLAFVLWMIGIFMVLNNIGIFLFAPGYGTELFGTHHLLIDGPWHWDLTGEQLFYQANVTAKYFAVLPAVLLFITTTRPPEFASSLNRIGVPYRAAYAVSLTMRYIPDVQREFRVISQAQQARGLDVSRKVGIGTRVRNTVAVLMPLLLGTFDRIEQVSAAMELRGFGRGRRRTWAVSTPLRAADWLVIAAAVLLALVPVALLWVNGGRFWNPFAG